jgi:hypothetical protein
MSADNAANISSSIAPPPPTSFEATTVSVAVVVGELPAAFVQYSV